MMDHLRRYIDPAHAKKLQERRDLANACMMTFEQSEAGRIVWDWLIEEHWNILTYHPDINVMMQQEARRQLVYQIKELIAEARKGEKKAVEVVA
jgi:hypothetical protein